MMTFGQDLDAMIEARNARELEEQNEEPEMDAGGVASELGYAWDELEKGYSRLAEACGRAEGFPAEYKIQSLIDRLENLQNEIRDLKREVQSA